MSTHSDLKSVAPDALRWIIILLCIAGLGVSAYLMWGYSTPGATLACGGSHGCETVKESAYSSIFGVSLPLIGLLSYAALLVLAAGQTHLLVIQRGWIPFVALALFGISLIGVLFSGYLTYLELYVIYAICRWCVASAVIMVLVFALSIVNLNRSNRLDYANA